MRSDVAIYAFLSIGLFVLIALVSRLQSGGRPTLLKQLSLWTCVINMMLAVLTAASVFILGSSEFSWFSYEGLGFGFQFDALSVIMWLMIAILGFVVMKFSFNYLDGDSRQGAFLGRLAAAIASVELLVLGGNLAVIAFAWVLTSISLHRLLLFYSNRPGAVIAARKKFIVARMSDVFLLTAFWQIYAYFGTGDLTTIFNGLASFSETNVPFTLELAMILLALAAIFKSALLPTHGWLIEVMETPTPVSALLHAGLLNAGPFLILRMSELFSLASYGSILLIVVGGFTAMFGSVVFMTQTSIKTALSFSSIAHMGFSLMVCGLGAFPAALLHLVGHSFYKAHSFLSSGGVIDIIRSNYVQLAVRRGSTLSVYVGLILGIGVLMVLANMMGLLNPINLPIAFVSLVILLGSIRLLITAFDTVNRLQLGLIVFALTSLLVSCFVLLEYGATYLLAESVADMRLLSVSQQAVLMLFATLFTVLVGIQVFAPLWKTTDRFHALAIHVKNGFYINTIFDRLVGAWSVNIPVAEQTDKQVDPKELLPELRLQYEGQSN